MNNFFDLDIDSLFENLSGLQFSQYGPLHQPVKKQKIAYKPNGVIELITISNGTASTKAIDHLPGTIQINEEKAVLESFGNVLVELRGVQPHSNNRQQNYITQEDELTEISSINEVYCKFHDRSIDDFQIEYVSKVESGYMFSNVTSKRTTETTEVKLKGGDFELDILESNTTEATDRSALFLEVDGIQLFLISLNKRRDESKLNDAVIVYLKTQPLEVRDKIRDCISFGLGKHIHYHGNLIMSRDYKHVELSCKANYSKVRKDSYHAEMPTPLGRAFLELGQAQTNRLVNALYANYDKYNLKHVLWGYWHALDAPLHIAGVHFGACIEAFQSAYVSQHPQNFPKKLIQKSKWKKFREQSVSIAESLDVNEQELQILINKINNLNQTPQSVISERFFDSLGIELSSLESAAWKERNNAAHGKTINDNEFEKQIRNIKILRCLFHRMLLIATDASNYYFDYYSLGYPIRLLNDSISEEIK